ncbi:hypothetical protein ACRYCC_11165 [Actinomadura scrupuli]|uniref:hypothetical protein n=1 Tax=Actinomadura scrupuli TaxID=559629 RepID=UPI003D969D5D
MAEDPDAGLVIQVGSLDIDIPRSAGYYGGVALAVAVGLIDPPLGIFIAAVPVLKMLTSARFPIPVRFIGQLLEGSARPVGGDAEGTIRWQSPQPSQAHQKAGPRPSTVRPRRPRPAPSRAGR